MKFTKMHGIGNDYVYVDCTKEILQNPSEVSIKVSHRHFGIGSDGLILIKKSDKADFFMEMYNADGSQSQMCGNGIRCVAKYVYDYKLTDKTTITVDTLAGIKILDLIVENGKVSKVKVNMGKPILKPELIPVDTKYFGGSDTVIDKPVLIDGTTYNVTCVSMGNPHAVVYLDKNVDIKKMDIEKIGPLFENNKLFPERINTEFIQVVDKQNLNMRVWERGSGETFACGTGACASLVATVLNGLCDNTATIHLLGGDLKITWEGDDCDVYMEGPAETVYIGEIEV